MKNLILSTIVLLAGCDYYCEKNVKAATPVPKDITYTGFISPSVLVPYCNMCHDTNGIPLDYKSIQDYRDSLVETLSTGYMPKKRPKLSQDLIDAVAKWIDEGMRE